MRPGDQIALDDIEMLNHWLRGARIERVMVGLEAGNSRVVIVTDRAHPHAPGVLALIFNDPSGFQLMRGMYQSLSEPEAE